MYLGKADINHELSLARPTTKVSKYEVGIFCRRITATPQRVWPVLDNVHRRPKRRTFDRTCSTQNYCPTLRQMRQNIAIAVDRVKSVNLPQTQSSPNSWRSWWQWSTWSRCVSHWEVALPTVALAARPFTAVSWPDTPTLSASQLLDIAATAGYFICGSSRVRSLCKTNPPTRAVDCRQPEIDRFHQVQRLQPS